MTATGRNPPPGRKEVSRWTTFTAALVEGNPANYRARGFVTSKKHGIVAGPKIHLPHEDCLMVAELVPGGLEGIHGEVDYSIYEVLS